MMQTTLKKFDFLAPPSRRLWLVAVWFAFLFASDGFAMTGGSVGVGFFQGPTSGATVNMFMSRSNSLKAIVPFSLENVILDYQHLFWDPFRRLSKRTVRLSLYLGLGGDLTLGNGGDNKKGEKDGSDSRASVRVPLGFMMRFVNFPVDVFVELAPSLQIYDGNEFGVDQADLDWKKVGVGARFYF